MFEALAEGGKVTMPLQKTFWSEAFGMLVDRFGIRGCSTWRRRSGPKGRNSQMAAQIEIHGYTLCPFAWRCRLAASEKGVSFDWLPADIPEPDPRSKAHNPNKRSQCLG